MRVKQLVARAQVNKQVCKIATRLYKLVMIKCRAILAAFLSCLLDLVMKYIKIRHKMQAEMRLRISPSVFCAPSAKNCVYLRPIFKSGSLSKKGNADLNAGNFN